MNTFSFRDIYERGEHVYYWVIDMEGNGEIRGSSNTIRQMYRDARRAIKRHRKMVDFLNPGGKRP